MESAAVRDISENSVYPGAFPLLFFIYLAQQFILLIGVVQFRVCYSEALHQNRILRVLRYPLTWCISFALKLNGLLICELWCRLVVRVRSREGRRNRAPPPRVRWKDGKKVNPAVAAAEDAKVAAAAAGKA